MTEKERLTATLNGETVDRPAVNFYEVGGFDVDPNNNDPFNIYNSPSWKELLTIAETETDLIRMRSPEQIKKSPLYNNFFKIETYMENKIRLKKTTIKIQQILFARQQDFLVLKITH